MQSKASLAAAQPAKLGFNVRLSDYIVYMCFGAVLIFFAFTIGDKGFLTVANLFNITRTTSMIAIMAVAMTFIISAGELDLSVGSIAALAALAAGLAIEAGYGLAGGVVAALAS